MKLWRGSKASFKGTSSDAIGPAAMQRCHSSQDGESGQKKRPSRGLRRPCYGFTGSGDAGSKADVLKAVGRPGHGLVDIRRSETEYLISEIRRQRQRIVIELDIEVAVRSDKQEDQLRLEVPGECGCSVLRGVGRKIRLDNPGFQIAAGSKIIVRAGRDFVAGIRRKTVALAGARKKRCKTVLREADVVVLRPRSDVQFERRAGKPSRAHHWVERSGVAPLLSDGR